MLENNLSSQPYLTIEIIARFVIINDLIAR